nr:GH25 family lysozyme [uncultured Eisenbergiella sp.]
MKKGIDVSTYQGQINWKNVKEAGCDFSIIRTTMKNNKVDPQFYDNLAGVLENNILDGYYKFTYSTTFPELARELDSLLRLLDEIHSSFPVTGTVWWDVEHNSLKNIGADMLTEMIKKAEQKIMDLGFSFGIYTGYSFYRERNFITEAFSCPLWIARYPLNKSFQFSDPIPEAYRPNISQMQIWQYTSQGRIRGISSFVDFNILYE